MFPEDSTLLMQRQMKSKLLKGKQINSFEELNMIDPFPSWQEKIEISDLRKSITSKASSRGVNRADKHNTLRLEKQGSQMINIDIDEPVYGANLIENDKPPRMVFLPSKLVLRKLMKLCSKCDNISDIYYFL